MAVVNVKAAVITNRDATPKVISNANIQKGMLNEAVGVCAIANGDSIASTYRFAQIPSNARVSQVLLYSPDIGTTTIADFGLYDTTDNGAAVVDADFFASAVSLKDGALNAQDITHEAGVFSIANAEKMVWEALGLSADPSKMYDVAATLTAAADAAGSVALKVQYAI